MLASLPIVALNVISFGDKAFTEVTSEHKVFMGELSWSMSEVLMKIGNLDSEMDAQKEGTVQWQGR